MTGSGVRCQLLASCTYEQLLVRLSKYAAPDHDENEVARSPCFSTTNVQSSFTGIQNSAAREANLTGGRAELQLHATKATNRITDQYCGDIALARESPITLLVLVSSVDRIRHRHIFIAPNSNEVPTHQSHPSSLAY